LALGTHFKTFLALAHKQSSPHRCLFHCANTSDKSNCLNSLYLAFTIAKVLNKRYAESIVFKRTTLVDMEVLCFNRSFPSLQYIVLPALLQYRKTYTVI